MGGKLLPWLRSLIITGGKWHYQHKMAAIVSFGFIFIHWVKVKTLFPSPFLFEVVMIENLELPQSVEAEISDC